jgi:hypothetical protein
LPIAVVQFPIAVSAETGDNFAMPTLIRLIVALAFLGGIGFAGLYALTIFVHPSLKEITVKIPQRELVLTPVLPKPEAPVTAAAVLPPADTSGTQVVDTPE